MTSSWWHNIVDRAADLTVGWMRSRGAFVQVIAVTLGWIPLVVLGVDNHGFIYLYIATALSLVTQIPLAMIGWKAMSKAESAEEGAKQTMEGMLVTMKSLQAIIDSLRHQMGEQDVILDEIHSTFFVTHCTKCGLPRIEGARFCSRCGTPYANKPEE
jgi:hypothetical protein